MTNPLLLRRDAIKATRARFEGQPFSWGNNDCAQLAAFHLRQLGYKPGLSRFGRYASVAMANRRLAAHGLRTVEDWLDGISGLDRVPALYAMPGDIVSLPAEGDMPGLTVFLGGNQVFGLGQVSQAFQSLTLLTAPEEVWRAHPLGATDRAPRSLLERGQPSSSAGEVPRARAE